MSYTGIRKGEALALKWDDIDFEKKTISINKNVGRTIDDLQIITPPKNQSYVRVIPINPILLEILKAEKTLSGSEWFFYNYTDKKIFHAATPHVWLKSIYAKLPDDFLHINVHGFRHTFATMYVENNPNSNPKELQKILGHSKITTTLDIYTHVTNLGKENMKNGIDNLDFRPKEKTAEKKQKN